MHHCFLKLDSNCFIKKYQKNGLYLTRLNPTPLNRNRLYDEIFKYIYEYAHYRSKQPIISRTSSSKNINC